MGVTDVWRRDATRLGENRGAGYGLVFLDPPYGKSLGEKAMADVISGGWLAPGAMVVWEESTPPAPVAGLTRIDQRKYGDTVVTLLRADPA
jgi:16S rRNA (guanine966-N2)-methyltransferase